MAYGLRKISPLDLRPSTAIGVALPFSAPNVFTSVYTTREQTKYNLINFLLTDPGERVFNPNFGAGLRARLFEQLDLNTFETVENSLTSQIENNFPQIQIESLKVYGSDDEQSINVRCSYTIKRSKEEDSLTVTIQNA